MRHVIVTTYDNQDPTVIGPFETYAEARDALAAIRDADDGRDDDDDDDSVMSRDVVRLIDPA